MKADITQNRSLVILSITPEASLGKKIVLFILNLLGIAFLVIGLYEWLLMLLPVGILWCMFFGWLTLWECFGCELVYISRTSLQFQKEYGIYQTVVESRVVQKALNISLIPAGEWQGLSYYQLIFESFNEQGRPQEIYRTTLAISANDLDQLKIAIRQLYIDKIDSAYLHQPYMLN